MLRKQASGENSPSGDIRRTRETSHTRSFRNSLSPNHRRDPNSSLLQQSFCSPPPPPFFESDALADLSRSLVLLPPRQGQLYAFLSVFSAMGKQGVISIAEGALPLPPEDYRCRACLSKLHAKYSERERDYSSGGEAASAAGDVEIEEIEPMPKVEYGTPEDTEQRLVYMYALAFLLQEQVLATEELGKTCTLPIFSCRDQRVPSVSILRFVQRLFKYMPCTKELYVVALVFIDRVIAYNPGMCITASNVHRLLFISMLVAAKFYDDLFYANYYMAKIGGVSVQEVLELEVEFLAAIRFSLYVDMNLFNTYLIPFEQLIGILKILPLDSTEADPLPPFRKYPRYGKWSWTSVDELFYHILTEKQKMGDNSSLSSASSASVLSQDLDLSEGAEWNHKRLLSPPPPGSSLVKEATGPSSSSSEDESEGETPPLARAGGEKPHHKHHHHHHHRHHHHHHHHHDQSSEKHRSKNRGATGVGRIETTRNVSSSALIRIESATAKSSSTSRHRRAIENVRRELLNGDGRNYRVARFKDNRKRISDPRGKYDRGYRSV